MQHRHHIGADLVGTIENEYIRNDTNTKLCPVMQMDRLLYYKSFKAIPHRKVGAILPEVI